jgi:3'-phosphoadenosine 5'-phosphosulfate sulfotransferase (PAPS reductase)/FAD synthetase
LKREERKGRSMERCSACVLPLNLVKHNRHNVCIHCQDHQRQGPPEWEKRRGDLRAIIESFDGKGKRYDFLVPMTGGKDSTYVLYYLTQVLGRSRVLTFTWDHLFHRRASWTNMENAVRAAGVDFYVFRILDEDTTRAVHRGFFRIFGHPCVSCFMLRDAIIMNEAIHNEIPLIVTGANTGQARRRGTYDHPGARSPVREAKERMGTISSFLRKAVNLEMPNRSKEIEAKTLGGVLKAMNQRDFSWPHYVDLGAFVDWYREDEGALLKVLGDTLHFQKASHTITHTSCWLERIRGYLEINLERLIIPRYAVEISSLVRDGVLTREEALLEFEKFGMTGSLPEETQDYLREVGLTMEEFKGRLKMPLPWPVKIHFVRLKALQALRRLLSREE